MQSDELTVFFFVPGWRDWTMLTALNSKDILPHKSRPPAVFGRMICKPLESCWQSALTILQNALICHWLNEVGSLVQFVILQFPHGSHFAILILRYTWLLKFGDHPQHVELWLISSHSFEQISSINMTEHSVSICLSQKATCSAHVYLYKVCISYGNLAVKCCTIIRWYSRNQMVAVPCFDLNDYRHTENHVKWSNCFWNVSSGQVYTCAVWLTSIATSCAPIRRMVYSVWIGLMEAYLGSASIHQSFSLISGLSHAPTYDHPHMCCSSFCILLDL